MDSEGIAVTERTRGWSVAGAFGRLAVVVLLGWAVAAGTALLSYVALRYIFVPIMVGFALCVLVVAAVMLLHGARWLGILAIVPGLLVLVGAVQYAPEAALEERGVREEVTITGEEGERGDKPYVYELRTADGRVLDERLEYKGDSTPYRVSDTLTVLRDPEGVVELEDAAKVEPDEMRAMLVTGASGWTLIAVLAARRGHVRRRRGLYGRGTGGTGGPEGPADLLSA